MSFKSSDRKYNIDELVNEVLTTDLVRQAIEDYHFDKGEDWSFENEQLDNDEIFVKKAPAKGSAEELIEQAVIDYQLTNIEDWS
jgi:hypothetical protein